MRYKIENTFLSVEVDSFGAELRSLKNKTTEFEYMWQADPKFWGRTSPVLFPFVGGLKNKVYKYKGTEYPMGQHGFARDMEFELVEQNIDSLWFVLKSNEETIKKYPFEFELKIGYVLKEKELEVLWEVKNAGKEEMYFSIGAHPAFNCPINGEADKSGYAIWFDKSDKVTHYGNKNDFGLADPSEEFELKLENNKAIMDATFFDESTYMIDNRQVSEVGIVDPAGKKYVSLKFDMPIVAVWSPEKKNAPFVCLEPWCGRCDAVDFEGELQDRVHGNRLDIGEVFASGYTIVVG